MNRTLRSLGLWLLLGLIVFTTATYLWQPQQQYRTIRYDEFWEYFQNGYMLEVTLVGKEQIKGVYKLPMSRESVAFKTRTADTSMIIEEYHRMLANPSERAKVSGLRLISEPEPTPPWWMTLLPSLLPLLLMIAFFVFFLNQVQGGGSRAMSFGKSRARLHGQAKERITFDDVAGVDEAKEELAEIVEFLKNPKRFADMGARIPKGILLVGPPGTGKTYLARAVAGEADVPFFIISGSDFVEMFVGVGASRVRDLFDQAKKNAPCIVFIDEIDAVGRQRGAGLGGGHDEREQTLNQLLVEMDGFEVNSGIIILAATNRPDVLDPALLRPGRFDRQIVVDIPDVRGREAILKIHARNKPLASDVDLNILARRTPGFTGADLQNVLNEAALLAARFGSKQIAMAHAEEAIERVIAGPQRKSSVVSDKEKDIVAYHESGHALVGKMLPGADPVHKVSIIPRGRAGGYTLQLPEEDRRLRTKSQMMNDVAMLLGGRVAEELVLGEPSTGAYTDLERATKIVRAMVTEYGMSERLGPLTFGKGHPDQVFLGRDIARDRDYSEEVAAAIDQEVRRIVDECLEMARSILTEHRDKLELLATTLKERETLERDEIDRLLGGEELDDPEPDQEPEVQAESVSSGGGTQERAANSGLPPTRPGQTVANDLRPAIE
ncbi:MAG: ATP-dependent zinc metalloprotease FtsH [Firmicutes bacterium]|nr:ATP-dependent zinc metalloprotease FtsH [Bacillota bacterium]